MRSYREGATRRGGQNATPESGGKSSQLVAIARLGDVLALDLSDS